MDPIQFIWEVVQAVFALAAAVVLPILVFWLIARRASKRR
jgi:Na+(H+)/acetate symporter ActP